MREVKRKTYEYTNDVVLSILSSQEDLKNEYVVFIQPTDVKDIKADIKKLDLYCSEDIILWEEMIVECYDNKNKGMLRVKDFWEVSENYYVSLWHNGENICSNVRK